MMMGKSKFSLESAYSWGFRTVIGNFGLFLLTMFVGILGCAVFLALIGVIDFWAFREHFGALSHFFSKVMSSATGPLHHGGHSIEEYLRQHLPTALSRYFADKHVLSLDISGHDLAYLFGMFGFSALFMKLFADLLAVGWIKMALGLQDNNKDVSERYLFKFYALVPSYFVVNLLAGFAVLASLGVVGGVAYGVFRDGHPGLALVLGVLAMLPGIYVHQRLRFAKYFVLDKGQGVVEALRSSWDMTCGSVVHLIVYSIFAAFVAALGSAVFLALFFVMPLAYQVDAHVYRQLVK